MSFEGLLHDSSARGQLPRLLSALLIGPLNPKTRNPKPKFRVSGSSGLGFRVSSRFRISDFGGFCASGLAVLEFGGEGWGA